MHSVSSSLDLVGTEAPFRGVISTISGISGLNSHRQIRATKVASVTTHFELLAVQTIALDPETPKSGDLVAVRVVSESATYGMLELPGGRLARIQAGDVIFGALGTRKALRGFDGVVPSSLTAGDRLHLLNMGGVMGICQGGYSEVGKPVELEFLGAIVGDGGPYNLRHRGIPTADILLPTVPVIAVGGACMNSGKTQVAIELIKHFSRDGYRVAAAKLSGVACLRDTLNMRDHGAYQTMSFLDCGLPSTVDEVNLAPVAKSILNELNRSAPDVIVVELGDGVIGCYNVDSILADPAIRASLSAFVYCAGDFVGAWGGIELMRDKNITIDVIAGACTDSAMGGEFIQRKFGVAAINALRQGKELYQAVSEKIVPKCAYDSMGRVQ